MKNQTLSPAETERELARLARRQTGPFSLALPSALTLTQRRLCCRGLFYGRWGPCFRRKSAPLRVPLSGIRSAELVRCRRFGLLALALLWLPAAVFVLYRLPALPSPWNALLTLDLALLPPALFSALFFLWPARVLSIQYSGGYLRLPCRWYSQPQLDSFLASLQRELAPGQRRTEREIQEEQAALALVKQALQEYAQLRRRQNQR